LPNEQAKDTMSSVAGTLIHAFGSIPRAAMTLGSIYDVGLIVPWFRPETRGRALPQ